MTVSNPSSVINASQNTSAPAVATTTSSSNATSGLNSQISSMQTEFFNLLTTELQNQDPTQPMDSNTMAQTLGEIETVQSTVQADNSIQSLATQLAANQVTNASSLVGMDVTATGNDVVLNSNSSASSGVAGTINYTLADAAANATITITNSAGNVVYSNTSTGLNAGQNQVLWDGTTNSGTTAPAGTYTFAVKATDAAGNPVTATTATSGVVQSVTIVNGAAQVNLGNGVTFPASTITSFSQNPLGAAAASLGG